MHGNTGKPRGVRGLAAYELALEVSKNTLKLLNDIHAPGDLVDQARRAVISIPLNIAEGAGRTGRDRRYHFTVAYGSGRELAAALDIIRMLGLVDDGKMETLILTLDRLNGMVWGLCR